MTAHSDLSEGDCLTLPCASCTSLSLDVRLVAGGSVRPCEKCGEITSVAIHREAQGWAISTTRIDSTPLD